MRRLGARSDLSEEARRFYSTVANGFIASQTAFLVGGSFLSQAHNDLTWYSFGLVAALDILARKESEASVAAAGAAAPELGVA